MSIRDRKDLKDELLKGAEESYDTREETGRFGTIFRKDVSVKRWKCKEGEHVLDIIPFEAGSHYPSKLHPNVKPGTIVHVLDLFVHRGIGVNEDSYVCPARNYDLPCPVCEHANKLRKEGVEDKELLKSLEPKRRVIYNVVCYDTAADEAKGVQVFEVAHFFMEKHLSGISRKPRGGGFVPFSHPDEGKQVFFERKGSGQSNTEYTNHQFLDRDYVISDEVLDSAHCLDDIIYVPTYEELSAAYWGKENQEKEDEELEEQAPPVRTRIPRSSPDSTSLHPTGAGSEEPLKEEPAPPPVRTRQQAEPAKPAEEPAPAPRQRQRATPPAEPAPVENKCPANGVFGNDIDRLEACVECKVWDDCAARADELEAERKAAAAAGGRRARA